MIGCRGCAEFSEHGNVTGEHPYCPLSGHVCVRFMRLTPDEDVSGEHNVDNVWKALRDTGSMLYSGLLWVACAASPWCLGKRIHRWCSCCSPLRCVRCGAKDPWT